MSSFSQSLHVRVHVHAEPQTSLLKVLELKFNVPNESSAVHDTPLLVSIFN